MRAFVALALFVPVAALAGPLDLRPLRMPQDAGDRSMAGDDTKTVTLRPYKPLATDNVPLKTLNFGPVEAEIGGQNHHIASYHIEGTRILGGSIGGSVDGGSAKLELTWPSH